MQIFSLIFQEYSINISSTFEFLESPFATIYTCFHHFSKQWNIHNPVLYRWCCMLYSFVFNFNNIPYPEWSYNGDIMGLSWDWICIYIYMYILPNESTTYPLPSDNQEWQWKITVGFNGPTTNWCDVSDVHCHVWLLEGTHQHPSTNPVPLKVQWNPIKSH